MKNCKARLSISIILLCILFCFSNTYAQKSAFKISGTALDSTQAPIVGATVLLLHAKDSVMEHYAITDVDGYFELKTKEAGAYTIQLSFIGYGTFKRAMNLEDETNIELGNVILSPDQQLLDGVTITDSFIPIVMNGDTVEYLADAFKTAPRAVVEDLLRQLPGVDVEEDGTIKVAGEKVDKVLVDGREFFGQDPKVATQNLPANIVEKVQVFDKASETAAFTGIDDGQEKKAINLKLKKDKNSGFFGSVAGEYGTDNHYEGTVVGNYFDDKSRASGILFGNDLSSTFYTADDRLSEVGRLEDEVLEEELNLGNQLNASTGNGLSTEVMGNINYSYRFSPKTDVDVRFGGSYSNVNKQSQSLIQNSSTTAPFTTNSLFSQNLLASNYGGGFKLSHELASNKELDLEGELGTNKFNNKQYNTANSEIFEQLTNTVTSNDNHIRTKAPSWKGKLSYRQRMEKKGRFLTVDLLNNSGLNNENAQLNNTQAAYLSEDLLEQTETIQQQDDALKHVDSKAIVTYSEPIGKAKYLGITASQRYVHTKRGKDFMDFDKDLDDYILNTDLSTDTQRDLAQSTLSTAFKVSKENRDITTKIAYQYNHLNHQFANSATHQLQQYHYALPFFSIKQQLTDSKSLNLKYDTRTRLPRLTEIQPVIDNTDPLNVSEGNPDLRPEYMHQFNTHLTSVNQFNRRFFTSGIHASYTDQAIVQDIRVLPSLSRYSKPVNFGERWHVGGFYILHQDVSIKDTWFKLGWEGNVLYQQSPLLLNEVASHTHLGHFSNKWKFSNTGKKTKIRVSLNYQLDVDLLRYENNKELNTNLLNHHITSSFKYEITDTWFFKTNYSLRYNLAQGKPFHFVDAYLGKTFYKDLFTASITVDNLLNNTESVRQSGSSIQVQETRVNRLGRVIMLGLSYDIKAFKK